MHHPGWIILLLLGVPFGVVWHRWRYAVKDHRSAKGRIRGARTELRKASAWALLFLVGSVAVLHVLL